MLQQLVRAFNANATSWIGLVTFLLVVALALLAPLISPYDPLDQDILARLQGPSAAHWFGTDSFGRDILSRLLWGARLSLVISTVSILAAMLIGGIIGIVSGYVGGRFDMVVMQAMDVLLSFPSLIMGLMVVAMLGASMGNLMIAIALTAIAPFARIARAPTILVKERDYIEACRALGYSDLRIMTIHILPNIVAEILVMGSLWLATAIRIEASLSFIGLGVRPPTPTWGGMIREGFENILDSASLSVFPSLAILLVVFSLNMLGDGLRDAIDPKLRGGENDADEPGASAPDPRSSRSRTSSPSFAPAAAGTRRCATSASPSSTTRRWRSSASPAAARASPHCRSWGSCRRPTGGSPAGTSASPDLDLVTLDEEEMRKIRGDRISMIFQEPMTSLNPVLTVGFQVAEALSYHRDMGRREADAAALELLDQVKIPSARQRFADYPHQFSGGMRQRVMIAMALACRPELLLADEPTTALDVTIQAEVLALLAELKTAYGMAMIFITHNLGVVASIADRVAAMYAGEIVETAPVDELFARPTHPYTELLLRSIPRVDRDTGGLTTIAGQVPAIGAMPSGCRFAPRCPLRQPVCTAA